VGSHVERRGEVAVSEVWALSGVGWFGVCCLLWCVTSST